jgi:hypothetical protein
MDQVNIPERLTPIRFETSPSFLSGHTQGAVVVWGYLAYHIKKSWFRVFAVLIFLLIGFSRMYVGVHFPQDVIGGFIVGVVYLILWILLEPKVREWLSRQTVIVRYSLAVLVPLVIWFLNPSEATATPMGAAIGLGVGFVYEGQTVNFSVTGSTRQRILRAVFGLVVILVSYFGLGNIFGNFDESMGETMETIWRLVRYAIIGFGGGWFLPWLFVKTGLADLKSVNQDLQK